jgi:serine/threonine-protein kinase
MPLGNETTPQLPIAGDLIGAKYRIERVIGRGGMGAVFAAQHELLHQRVALKFLLPQFAENETHRARFLNEARAAARIRSEHVAAVLDVGLVPGGGAYIALEFLEGSDLRAVCTERGPLPIVEAVGYVLQALEGLAHAHVLGIVHRDLKPSNLFRVWQADGSSCVKVLDFGVSKLLSLAAESDAMQQVTATQELVGSPSYMAPEQMRDARTVDARADVWSAGVILFRLVTAGMPFEATTLGGVVAAVVADRPRTMRSLRPDVPEELERVVMRCLEKAPDDRYPTVGALAEALVAFAPEEAPLVSKIIRTVGVTSAPGTQHAAKSGPSSEVSSPLPTALVSETSSPSVTDAISVSFSEGPVRTHGGPTLVSAGSASTVDPSRSAFGLSPLSVVAAALGGIGLLAATAWWTMSSDTQASPPATLPAATVVASAAAPAAPYPAASPTELARAAQPAAVAANAPNLTTAAGELPHSCAEARELGVSSDGPVRIDPDGSGARQPFEVYCASMTGADPPREYLTLAHGDASGEPDANATRYVWRGGPCTCPDLVRRFSRVRIDPTDLTVDPQDGTFASYDRPLSCEIANRSHCGEQLSLAWGGAGSCRGSGDTSGRATIDLRGTPFSLAPGVAFEPSGFAAAGTATVAKDRKTALMTGGGLCGAMAPSQTAKLALVQQR